MKKNIIVLAALVVAASSCTQDSSTTLRPSSAAPQDIAMSNASFSLMARRGLDGRVSGQWKDELAKGAEITVDVSCLHAEGDQVWVGGIITQSGIPELLGRDAFAVVGRSGATSYSIIGTGMRCTDARSVPLLEGRETRLARF